MEQHREYKKFPTPAETIKCLKAAGSTYLRVTNAQPQNKKEVATVLSSHLKFKSSTRSLQDLSSKYGIVSKIFKLC